ncbi:pyridoxal-phosphate dependent enzyme [Neolewinella antarctica]|uniref:Threonine synthase n=1 Tax=Neolewinella antarctica TaxID=442734 RepID=A0ABX0XGU7_9BACT|nr:pyridoxal-phosphate dependent enzyme [Neolewinella antarctica]NJC28370.1 threonine synthase [Neolewinella antarctica]
MTLRDNVTTAANTIGSLARESARIAADKNLASSDRAQAFRTIIAKEVGQTWMRPSKAFERDFGLENLYLKFEGDNPTGTQKDRIAFAQVAEALENGQNDVALATCGNYGVAVALACQLAGLNCHIFLPAGYHSDRLHEMEALGGKIYRPDGTYETVVAHSSLRAADEGWYNANPGGKNAQLQIEAYSGIGKELIADLGEAPATCAVPVSNGTLLAGIHHGTKAAGSTRYVAGSSTAKNPIVYSFRRGLTECVDLDPAKMKETRINEPLINWHSFDGQEALNALHASKGAAYNISDERMRKMTSYLANKEALRVLPASTAGLISLLRMHEEGVLGEGKHVAILTAKR